MIPESFPRISTTRSSLLATNFFWRNWSPMSPMPMWVLLWFGSVVSWGCFHWNLCSGLYLYFDKNPQPCTQIYVLPWYQWCLIQWYSSNFFPEKKSPAPTSCHWSQCPDIESLWHFKIFWHSSVSDILTPRGRRLELHRWKSEKLLRPDWAKRRWEISLSLRSSQRSTKAYHW